MPPSTNNPTAPALNKPSLDKTAHEPSSKAKRSITPSASKRLRLSNHMKSCSMNLCPRKSVSWQIFINRRRKYSCRMNQRQGLEKNILGRKMSMGIVFKTIIQLKILGQSKTMEIVSLKDLKKWNRQKNNIRNKLSLIHI